MFFIFFIILKPQKENKRNILNKDLFSLFSWSLKKKINKLSLYFLYFPGASKIKKNINKDIFSLFFWSLKKKIPRGPQNPRSFGDLQDLEEVKDLSI